MGYDFTLIHHMRSIALKGMDHHCWRPADPRWAAVRGYLHQRVPEDFRSSLCVRETTAATAGGLGMANRSSPEDTPRTARSTRPRPAPGALRVARIAHNRTLTAHMYRLREPMLYKYI